MKKILLLSFFVLIPQSIFCAQGSISGIIDAKMKKGVLVENIHIDYSGGGRAGVLNHAAHHNDEKTFNSCMQAGLIAIKKMLLNENSQGNRPLFGAATNGNAGKKMVVTLLHFNADPNHTNNEGNTALHEATAQGSFEVVQCIALNPDCNRKTVGSTIDWATRTGFDQNKPIMNLLINRVQALGGKLIQVQPLAPTTVPKKSKNGEKKARQRANAKRHQQENAAQLVTAAQEEMLFKECEQGRYKASSEEQQFMNSLGSLSLEME